MNKYKVRDIVIERYSFDSSIYYFYKIDKVDKDYYYYHSLNYSCEGFTMKQYFEERTNLVPKFKRILLGLK